MATGYKLLKRGIATIFKTALQVVVPSDVWQAYTNSPSSAAGLEDLTVELQRRENIPEVPEMVFVEALVPDGAHYDYIEKSCKEACRYDHQGTEKLAGCVKECRDQERTWEAQMEHLQLAMPNPEMVGILNADWMAVTGTQCVTRGGALRCRLREPATLGPPAGVTLKMCSVTPLLPTAVYCEEA